MLAAAVQADLSRLETDAAAREAAAALAGWLLPIAKTFGAETAFDTASEAVQVLGGAGYVKDWPVEQYLRDSRVLAIFEGDQRHAGAGPRASPPAPRPSARAWTPSWRWPAAISAPGPPMSPQTLCAPRWRCWRTPRAALASLAESDAAAYPFLCLAALAATGWIALRLTRVGGEAPAARKLRTAGRHWLGDLAARAALEHARIGLGGARISGFEDIRRR
ncbi:MAG: acyl-CoA dehydrogenase family protein [Caulobacteraceae bacterium]